MLITILLILSTLAAARGISPSALRASIPYGNPDLLDGLCTFTIWQRQISSVNYIQINTILDHSNNITIDVASQRPATAFNSYTRLDQDHALAVTGLLDDKNLTITHAWKDKLRFEYGEVEWSTQWGHGKARCEAREWKGSPESRERRLDCAFPCEKVAAEDLEEREEYRGAPKEESQVRIGLR